MPRQARWTVLGILGLSVLMCGGCSAEAQSEAAGTRQAAGARQQAGGQALPAGEAADLRDSVDALRAEVSQLRREVTRLRAQVAEGSGAAEGTGGAGTAGTAGDVSGTGAGAQTGQGTGGAGTGGTGVTGAPSPIISNAPTAGSTVPAPRGTAVVNAVYTGVIRSVSERQVVIAMDDGGPLVLEMNPATHVYREGRSIGVKQLKEGEQVRAVVDLVGQDKTLEIAVLPAATPEG
ncbi:hypothetical protein ACLESD_04515 [Pyxidicoccus sp. 3LFB2]